MIVTTPTVAATFQSIGRWAEMSPAAPSGIVLSACELTMYRPDQELVPDEDGREDRGHDHARSDERQHDPPEHADARAAVDHRGIVELARDLVEEADEDPDRRAAG